MQKSQSLRARKFKALINKTSKNIEINKKNNEEEKYNKNKKGGLPQISDLCLPVKKIPHVTNRKDRNKNINKISLEKLRQILINIKKNRKESNYNKRITKLTNTKRKFNTTFRNNNNSNNKKINNKCLTIAKETNKNTSDINININNIKNTSKTNIKEFNYNTEIIQIYKENKDPKYKERSYSIKNDINNCSLLKEDLSQIKNESKRWYDIDNLTEKYNNLIITSEDLEKNLMNKYLTGAENIISEIEEPQYLKEDSQINTLNANISSKKQLSIRETTLDTSYQNNSCHNCTDILKVRKYTYDLNKGVKNYKKIIRKFNTNLTDRSPNNIRNRFNNTFLKDKIMKKINSFNKRNVSNNSENIIVSNELGRFSKNKNNSYSLDFRENLRESKNNINNDNSTKKSISAYKNRRKIKNKNNKEKNNNQFLSIINEANDLIKPECKKKFYRPILRCAKGNKNRFYDKKTYNHEFFKNKFKNSRQYINELNQINLYFTEKKKSFKNHYHFTHINDNINSSINDYELGPIIGIGSYAEVKLGIHKITRKKYAIKIYQKDTLDDEDKKNCIKNEIYILNQLDHENIMKLYDIINTPKYLFLILEYINGISLLDFIQKLPEKRIEENLCKKIFYQIVKAIHYCSKKNIFHRDIKLENILLINKENIKIKLIDFGFAIKCNKKEYQKFFCGTLNYMPPEIINKKKYLPYYSDIWSLGVLLYTMIYGRFPFNDRDEDILFDLINEGKFEFPNDIETSDEVKNLIKKIIVVQPDKRANLNEIINNIWFKS